jgi:hypothetical protein
VYQLDEIVPEALTSMRLMVERPVVEPENQAPLWLALSMSVLAASLSSSSSPPSPMAPV